MVISFSPESGNFRPKPARNYVGVNRGKKPRKAKPKKSKKRAAKQVKLFS
jgi:hypothetical protein